MSRAPQTPRMAGTPRMATLTTSAKVSKKKTKTAPTGEDEGGQQTVAGTSSTMAKPTTSTGAVPKTTAEPKTKQTKEFTLPAFSTVVDKKKKEETEFEKLKKKNIRRVIAEGEDIKMIKDILRGLRDQDIYVQEFVMKIGPYTGDNGDCLRQVMADELASFRKLAVKVYDTMTQDVSDVLTNEHAELLEFYREKTEFFNSKTAQCLYELYDICPNFNFEQYYSENRNEYLQSLFPIPEEEDIDPEEFEMQKRQQLYHRLQWLRSEGDRLNAENKMLQKRLTELKRQQKEVLHVANEAMLRAEERKRQLEEAEAKIGERLDVLNESIEKGIVQQEQQRLKAEGLKAKASTTKKQATRKKSATQKPEWNVGAAAEIEGVALQQTVQTEVSKASASTSQMAARKKVVKAKFKRPPSAKSGEEGGFHFSPIKTPPQQAQTKKQVSPFHYSPPKTPPQQAQTKKQASPFHYSPPKTPPQERPTVPTQTTRVEATTVVTEEAGPSTSQAPPRLGRRQVTAPRDTWGGFY